LHSFRSKRALLLRHFLWFALQLRQIDLVRNQAERKVITQYFNDFLKPNKTEAIAINNNSNSDMQ
jgi:hypothetical protein